MSGLGTFLVGISGAVVKKALTTLGIGVVSYAALSTALNSALDAAKGAFSGFGGDAASLVALSGMPEAFSIIAGAMVARVAMMSLNKLEVLK